MRYGKEDECWAWERSGLDDTAIERRSGVGVEGNIEDLVVCARVKVEDLPGRSPRGRGRREGGGQAEVREDGLDDGGVLDGLHRNHSVTAARAAQNVVVKKVGKEFSPRPAIGLGYGYRVISLDSIAWRCQRGCAGLGLLQQRRSLLAGDQRSDSRTCTRIGGEKPMKPQCTSGERA